MEKVYILGGAQTDFERNWSKEGKNVIALLKEVVTDGFKNSKIDYDYVIELNKDNKIACFIGNFMAEKYIDQGHLGALMTEVDSAFYGVPSARYEAACASGSVALDAAISKIKLEEYDMAIVVGWELMKTVDSKVCGEYLGRAAYYEKEGKDLEYPFPVFFGRITDEVIKRYKINENIFMDTLSIISNKNYSNAKRNPLAQTRKWFMNLEKASSRGETYNPFIGGKLAVSDCSQVTDGAAMVVLVSENFLKRMNLNVKDYSLIKGYGHRVAPMQLQNKLKESISNEYILPWTRKAIEDAYRRANLSVKDIDFFETHDCFSCSEYIAVSAFGICNPGDEYKVIKSGMTDFDGSIPVNASGGLIGCGHPVGASGVRMMLDLHKQITGQAEAYQLRKARNGMMLNIGGTATTNYTFILGRNETVK